MTAILPDHPPHGASERDPRQRLLSVVTERPRASARLLQKRRSDIQGLRAIAVLFVVLYHSGTLLPGGFTGVDVFFAISGFVIAGSLTGEVEQSRWIALGAFYGRRARRLLPGLAVMLVFVVPAATLLGPAASLRAGSLTGVFASLFAANVYLASLPTGYFASAATLNPLLHTWTLAVEEQFYLVFPLVLVAGNRLRGRAAATALVAGATAASFAYAMTSPEKTAFYGAPARAWEFGAGACLFLVSPILLRLSPAAGRLLGLVGLGSVVAAALAVDLASRLGDAAVVPVLGAVLLLAAGTVTQTGASRALSTPLLVWIGDRSYGWYLWHWPLIVFATALWPGVGWAPPLAAAASLLPTWLSYRAVENPIRFSPTMDGRRAVTLGLGCTMVSLAACCAALVIEHELHGTTSMTSWRQSQAPHADLVRNCDSVIPLPERPRSRCTWTVPRPRGSIVLFGDSNAGHFTEPVVQAGTASGYDVTVVTASGCPYVPLSSSAPCSRFARSTLDAIVRRRPSLLILASRTDLYLSGVRLDAQNGRADLGPAPPVDARLWLLQLGNVLSRLNRAGIPVVLVHPVPLVQLSAPSCAVVRVLTGSCGSSIPRTAAERELRSAVQVENAAAARAPASWAIGVDDEICSASRCSTAKEGIVMYLNRDHLSVRGALTLTPLFAQAIRLHARAPNASQKGP